MVRHSTDEPGFGFGARQWTLPAQNRLLVANMMLFGLSMFCFAFSLFIWITHCGLSERDAFLRIHSYSRSIPSQEQQASC